MLEATHAQARLVGDAYGERWINMERRRKDEARWTSSARRAGGARTLKRHRWTALCSLAQAETDSCVQDC